MGDFADGKDLDSGVVEGLAMHDFSERSVCAKPSGKLPVLEEGDDG